MEPPCQRGFFVITLTHRGQLRRKGGLAVAKQTQEKVVYSGEGLRVYLRRKNPVRNS